MINLPYSTDSTADFATAPQLPEGTHTVKISEIKMITTKATGEEKLLVSYANESGEFQDWLGFRSAPQAKRTYAYTCRLHELAGVPVAKGAFDETPLIGATCKITLAANDKGYMGLVGFPEAVAPDTSDIPF